MFSGWSVFKWQIPSGYGFSFFLASASAWMASCASSVTRPGMVSRRLMVARVTARALARAPWLRPRRSRACLYSVLFILENAGFDFCQAGAANRLNDQGEADFFNEGFRPVGFVFFDDQNFFELVNSALQGQGCYPVHGKFVHQFGEGCVYFFFCDHGVLFVCGLKCLVGANCGEGLFGNFGGCCFVLGFVAQAEKFLSDFKGGCAGDLKKNLADLAGCLEVCHGLVCFLVFGALGVSLSLVITVTISYRPASKILKINHFFLRGENHG